MLPLMAAALLTVSPLCLRDDDTTIKTIPCWDSAQEFEVLQARQQVKFVMLSSGRPGMVQAVSDPSKCFTMAAGGNTTFGLIKLAPCTAGDPAQVWTTVPTIDSHNRTLCKKSAIHPGCRTGLAARNAVQVCSGVSPIHPTRNGPVAMVDSKTHNWRGGTCVDYDSNSSTFRYTSLEGEPHMCLGWGPSVRPCDKPSPAAVFPMCNTALSMDERVKDLVSRLEPSEKPALLLNTAPAITRMWLPAIDWWQEALHGLTKGNAVGPNGTEHLPVSFPDAITSAASFNKSQFFQIGAAIGTEARVNNNVGQATGWTYWTPNLNIFRDPRWGRGHETPGEDPVLNAQYGANFIAGFQGDAHMPQNGTSRRPLRQLKASACAKHFLAYSLENCYLLGDNCRFNFNANISQQELEDTYLPAFQAAVEVGGVSGLMCSENSVNDIPSCANKWALTHLARDSWGFSGYVTGDCGAVDVGLAPYPTGHYWKKGDNGHGYRVPGNGSFESAGLDQNCDGGGPSPPGSNALGTKEDQDRALGHNFKVLLRLGVFDPLDASPFNLLGWEDMGSMSHQQLALDAARDGHVLLKNNDNTLPLDASSLSNISMVGPNWEVRAGGYSGGGSRGKFTVTTVEAVNAYLNNTKAKTKVVVGCAKPNGTNLPASHCDKNPDMFAAALVAAADADVTLISVGIDDSFEGENHDYRAITADIGLPGAQQELVEAVAEQAAKPVIVLVTGTSVDLAPLKANPRVGAILWRGYAGEASGQATADVLFGKHNPAGRLTSTFYDADFVKAWRPGVDPYTGGVSPPHNASYFDHHVQPNTSSGNPGRSYRYYTGTPAYAFGTGLSYTDFQYQLLSAEAVTVPVKNIHRYALQATLRNVYRRDSRLSATVHMVVLNVTNIGKRQGSHSLLSFISSPNAGTDGAPLRSLTAFEKVHLQPGHSTVVHLPVTTHDLTLVATNGGRRAVSGKWTLQVGDDSLNTTCTLHVT